MAEEKKTNTVKIKITAKGGWQLMDKFYPEGSVVDLEINLYEAIKKFVKHEVVK